ncbi:hypothetical protein RHMOL_Rhmol10G0132300 [Rhododendron molle]|uniref:Uncharacterized protein n=1 Tax=Rhododendron molle TaxID=49168 RepID=A0ACC0M2W8_RHOML|nr:hypothetical protein RHMOL_Rhmol10G0132300 [Rhododendron molle]
MELADEGEGERLRFRLVERGAGVRREVWVKDVEMQWVCLILEDVSSGYERGFLGAMGVLLEEYRLEEGVAESPSAMEEQRWAQRSWKVTTGVQVSDLGGVDFLFTLPSVEEAQRVMRSRWSFTKRRIHLEWRSPVGCCVKKGEAPSVVWVRILGLPQHLWDSEAFSGIGDFCGGFVRVDDNTRRRDNLRWARIAIRAAPAMIPTKVKVAKGGWVFDLSLWVEKGPLVGFQPALNVGKGGGRVVTFGSDGRELVVHSLEKTRGGVSRRARGGWGNGSYGDRGFSKSESRISCGPGRGVGRHKNNSNWMRPKPAHHEYNRSGSDVKWGYLFKWPVWSKLVEIKNKRWVSVADSGGGPSFSGASPSQRKGEERSAGIRPGPDVLSQQRSASVEGVGVGTSRSIRGCSVDSGEVGSRGMELVAFSGLTVRDFSVRDNQRDELFNNLGNLGWVEEVIEDGQLVCNDLCEPIGMGINEDKLMVGMSQDEVSKWVLKRISGFSKLLGVSYDGFEDRNMCSFLDIEERWKKGVVKETKKGGNKANSGAREFKRLESSINYDSRKKEKGGRYGLILYLLMKIKILNWNVRGLNEREKRGIVKLLLKEWKADVVCLQETKLKEASKDSVKDLWGVGG